jgi:hypothetical protein
MDLDKRTITPVHFIYRISYPVTNHASISDYRDYSVMVFASPSGEFYRSVTSSRCLSGHTHLDNFIVTPKSCSSIGTIQKTHTSLEMVGNSPLGR